MALAIPPSLPDLRAHCIKPKAPPNISEPERSEIEQSELEEFPAPDPNDPFALASNQSDLHPSSDNWYPIPIPPGLAFPALNAYSSANDVITPLRPLSKSHPQQETHYKRRASNPLPSSPHLSSYASRATRSYLVDSNRSSSTSPPPSLVHSSSDDSSTDVDIDPFPVDRNNIASTSASTSTSASSQNKLARSLLPKKSTPKKSILVDSTSRPRTASPTRRVRENPTTPPLSEVFPSTAERGTASRSSRLMPNERQFRELTTHSFSHSSSRDFGTQSQPERLPSSSRALPHVSTSSTCRENVQNCRLAGPPIPISLDAHAHYAHVSFPFLVPPVSHPSENVFVSPRPVPAPSSTPNLPIRQPRRPSTAPGGTLKKSKSQTPTTSGQGRSGQEMEPHGEFTLPTPSQLAHAASLPVIAESGLRIAFGSLFENQRTIVLFIRHFWCPLCQDYMTSLTSLVPPLLFPPSSPKSKAKNDNAAQLVIIGNGAYTLISKYKQIFGMKFNVYTDPTLAVYSALGMGMTRMRDEKILRTGFGKEKASEDSEKAKEDSYVKHGLMTGITMVVMRALKVGMPVWEKGGDIGQLGGEFVLGPGLTCTFAHRMQGTKGHMPILDVLKVAEVTIPPSAPTSAGNPDELPARPASLKTRRSSASVNGEAKRENVNGVKGSATRTGKLKRTRPREESQALVVEPTKDEDLCMEERQRSLARLKEKKKIRRQSLAVGIASISLHERGGMGVTSQSESGDIGGVEESLVAST